MTSKDETKDEKSSDTESTETASSKKEKETSESTSNGQLDQANGKTSEDESLTLPTEKDSASDNTQKKEKEENSSDHTDSKEKESEKDTNPKEESIDESEKVETKPKTPTRASKRKLQEMQTPEVDSSKSENNLEIKLELKTEDDSEGFQGFPASYDSSSLSLVDAHFMDSSSSEKDNLPKSIPESDIMGKGKRARVPNKRYSEIALSNSRKSLSANRATEIEFNENITIKEEPVDLPLVSVCSPQLSQPPAAKKGRMSSAADLQDPKYLKPFKHGWKRELVWRSVTSNDKRNGDIYYYTPTGKKVRSMREVSEHIDNRILTMENFTYYKASLGLNDPEKEVIRDAKVASKSDSPAVKNVNSATKSVSSPLVKNIAKPASKKIMSPKINSPKIMSPKINSPKINSPKISSPKVMSPKVMTVKVEKSKLSELKSSTTKEAKAKKDAANETPPNKKNNTKVVLKKTPSRAVEPTKTPAKTAETKTPAKVAETKTPAKTAETKSPAKAAHVTAVAAKPLRKGRSANTPVKAEEPMDVDTSPSPVRLSPLKTKIARFNNNNKNKKNLRGKKITNANSTNHTEEKTETKFMENYLQNLSFGYNTLLYVFQYLKVQDLLRAGCVCTMWRDIASHPILWKTVRMKNSQVHSFEGLANTLKSHGTINLDLRKMLLPNSGDEIWPEFSKAIEKVDTLRKIELCRCPASVVEQLAVTNPKLEVINAVTIKCEVMDLESLQNLTEIKELRLKATNGLNISSIDSLKELNSLKVLSLTSVNELHRLNLSVLGELTHLEQLDLGECTDFPKSFGKEILSKLKNLDRLRLEKGQGSCHTFEILDAVKNMPRLEQLELVNFDVKSGFDKALGSCANLKKLMIIPTYISQSATTNNMVLSGVLRLQGSLSHFVWGVTLELLRVTELFVDQCEEPKEKKEKKTTGNGDSIPVLKPVPDLTHSKEIPVACNPPQVEILPLPNLQKLLLNSLPTTRVKILKIPFHATWRQTLTDSV